MLKHRPRGDFDGLSGPFSRQDSPSTQPATGRKGATPFLSAGDEADKWRRLITLIQYERAAISALWIKSGTGVESSTVKENGQQMKEYGIMRDCGATKVSAVLYGCLQWWLSQRVAMVQGFTLIELMVTLSVAAILFTVGD